MTRSAIMLLPLLALLLAACSGHPVRGTTAAIPGPVAAGDCGGLEDAARLRLMTIEDELQAGRARAALAHLDSLPASLGGHAKAVYLRAEALRAVADYPGASHLYRSLLPGCLAGAGHHGLGLVAAAQADFAAALEQLHQARLRLPADPKVRNDYGYALLLAGRVPEARVEFETVLELSEHQSKAAGNLVLVMLVEGREEEAARLARGIPLTEAGLETLRQRALVLRNGLVEEDSRENLY